MYCFFSFSSVASLVKLLGAKLFAKYLNKCPLTILTFRHMLIGGAKLFSKEFGENSSLKKLGVFYVCVWRIDDNFQVYKRITIGFEIQLVATMSRILSIFLPCWSKSPRVNP
jgi:hypothetical protein